MQRNNMRTTWLYASNDDICRHLIYLLKILLLKPFLLNNRESPLYVGINKKVKPSAKLIFCGMDLALAEHLGQAKGYGHYKCMRVSLVL